MQRSILTDPCHAAYAVPAAMLEYESLVLLVGGLDTVATVKVNHQTVGATNNMFRRYILDLKSALKVSSVEQIVMISRAKRT